MGIGDWGLGIGDWGLGIGPNPQSPLKYLMNFLIYFILYFSINNKYFIFNEFRKNVFDYLIFILFIIIFL